MKETEREKPCPILSIEAMVVAGEITKDKLDQIKHQSLAIGLSVEKYVETNLIFNRWKWNEEGRLVPDYENIGGRVGLDSKEQEALRQKALDTGKHPTDLIRSFIREGLGLSDKDGP